MPFENVGGVIASIGIVALLAGIAMWQITASRRAEKARGEGASARGWEYRKTAEPRVARYVFSGQTLDGVPWQIESVVKKSGTGSSLSTVAYTRWFTEAVSHPDQVVVIGPSPGDTPAGLNLGGSLARHLLRMMLQSLLDGESGDEARLSGLKETRTGGETFGQSYFVFATDESVARDLLGGKVESALINWAMGEKDSQKLPAVLYWHRGLQIRLGDDFSADMAVLDRLAALGETLVEQKL